MSTTSHQPVSDADWNQLMTLASGFLALEEGDVAAAMSRAIKAHSDLIQALKNEQIIADLGPGMVTMFVPDEGGVALRMQRHDPRSALVDEETQGLDAPEPKLPRASRSTYYVDEDVNS